jgi:hypothetical protein
MEPTFTNILISMGIILLLEGLLTLTFLWITKIPIRLILWLLAINGITVPATLLILPVTFQGFAGIPAFFLASWVAEAVVLAVLWRKHLKIHVVIAFAFAINFFSTLVGIMLFMMVTASP